MTKGDRSPTTSKHLQFRLLAILLLVADIALWLGIWRSNGSQIIFVTACVPFGLCIYAAASVGGRYGYPVLVGSFTGVVFGILGTVMVYGLLDDGPLEVNDFGHLTITGLAVGLACGLMAWVQSWTQR